MAENGGQEKTELATPRKRRNARNKGQVARSQELSSFLLLMAGLLAMISLSPSLGGNLAQLMTDSFRSAFNIDLNTESLFQLGKFWVRGGMTMIMPLWAVLLVVAVGGSVMQVGFNLNGDLLTPKPERINPLSGFKRIFSKRTFFEMIKSIVKMTLLLTIAWKTLEGEQDKIVGLAELDLVPALAVLGKVIGKMAGRIMILLVILAISDYAYQRWHHEQDIMMTKQELKEEYKETEGDPMLKSRVRALQREIAMRRMMEDVKEADVVVTNPTHYAVALKYEEGMRAPTVMAKGKDKVAQKIKETARENKIPVVENKPLARAIFAKCKVGDSIPLELFEAVAELLAVVFRARAQAAGMGV
ncbi:MAG: flagellar biosynthesis protein FlhB [bacterium]|nr:flagellar biosynthesis protein FlhB [bacterium]